MKENKLINLSMDFSAKIIKLCENIKGHYSLVNQLERSATSIGANIHEANYAHGKADFIAKLQICSKRLLKLLVSQLAIYRIFSKYSSLILNVKGVLFVGIAIPLSLAINKFYHNGLIKYIVTVE